MDILIYCSISIAFIICFICVFSLPCFSFLDGFEKRRFHQLDGLRFFASISIALHHVVYSYNYTHGKKWEIYENYTLFSLGHIGVVMFFMLSSYLLTARNIEKASDWIRFYIKRFFRLAPMMWVSALCCIVISILLTNNINYVSMINIIYWFDFGITFQKSDITSFHDANLINGGVMWTMPWVWFFSLVLPFVCILRNFLPKIAVTFTLLCFCIYCLPKYSDYSLISLIPTSFCYGILARDLKGYIQISHTTRSWICVFSFVMLCLVHDKEMSYTSLLFQFIIFFMVVDGCDIFGILRSRGAVRLGELTFSVYLIHGIFLFWMNRIVLHFFPSCSLLSLPYMSAAFVTLLITLLCSCLTFVFVEKKSIALGRHIAEKYVTE